MGCPLLLYLAAAGVGTIGIIDFDTVSISNLHRQILYHDAQSGTLKSIQAQKQLQRLNPLIRIESYSDPLTPENALSLISQYDIIADGTDNFPTRYLINDACVLCKKPNVFASVYQYEGQVAVFNFRLPDGTYSPHYRDLFPEPPDNAPNCAEGGVLGVLPGIIGSMQALEVLKIITGIGEVLAGKLFRLDTLTFRSQVLSFKKSTRTPDITKLSDDYQSFCGLPKDDKDEIPEITADEWHERMKQGEHFQVIDVREPHEYEQENINGLLIPLGDLEKNISLIDRNRNVIIHCQSGIRSAKAVKLLRERFGYQQVFNLKGGITSVTNP